MQGPKWPLFYSYVAHVWSLLIVETGFVPWIELPVKGDSADFREWCRVTRHPRVFRRLTGCQRDTPVLGRHKH